MCSTPLVIINAFSLFILCNVINFLLIIAHHFPGLEDVAFQNLRFILPSLSVLHIPFVHSFLSVSPKDINFSLFYFVCFFLDIFFTYISNVIPFSGFSSENPLSPPHFPCSPTHPLPLPSSGVPLHSGIKLSQDQGPVLPLMTNKAILCCICSWSHGFLHVYSLVGGLVPGHSGEGIWMVDIMVPSMGLQNSSSPSLLSIPAPLGTLWR